jgi:hypothetical protein
VYLPSLCVYLRYLNFIYFECAFQMAYITLLCDCFRTDLFIHAKSDVENLIRIPPTHTVVLLSFFASKLTANSNETELCSMLFYFPIFNLLKMQISIELVVPLRVLFLLVSSRNETSFLFHLIQLQIFNFLFHKKVIGIFELYDCLVLFCQVFNF